MRYFFISLTIFIFSAGNAYAECPFEAQLDRIYNYANRHGSDHNTYREAMRQLNNLQSRIYNSGLSTNDMNVCNARINFTRNTLDIQDQYRR